MLLNAIETVDITKEIPLKYWIVFIFIMAVVLPVSHRIFTKMFIPKEGDGEAPVWSAMDKKDKK